MIEQFSAEVGIGQIVGTVLFAGFVFLVFKAIIGGNGNGKNGGGGAAQ